MGFEIVIYSLMSLFGVWYFVFALYPDYCVDRFRQEMFGLRDCLFDKATDGTLSFDDKMYGVTRVTMNGFIRFSHEINLASFITTIFARRAQDEHFRRFREKRVAALGELDQAKRDVYETYFQKMNILVVKYIFLSSPVLACSIILPLVAYALMVFCLKQILGFLKNPLARADSIAYAGGDA